MKPDKACNICGSSKDATCCHNGLTAFFNQATRAFIVMFIAMVMLLGFYVLVQMFRPKTDMDFSKTVHVSGDGFFAVVYDDAELARFFAPEKIGEIKRTIDEKAERLRSQGLSRRRQLLIGHWAFMRQRVSTVGAPGWFANDPESRKAEAKTIMAVDSEKNVSDEDLKSTHVVSLRAWIENQDSKISGRHREQYRGILAQQQALIDEEDGYRALLVREINGLKPVLNFDWLYHEDAGWVLEVVVWSIIGAMCNTIAGLIMSCHKGKYDPCKFVQAFPKMLLAPVLAVVAIAVWSSGFSKSPITFLNLPYFLLTAFILGFSSTRVLALLRTTTNMVLAGAELSEEKIFEAGKKSAYEPFNPYVARESLPKPRTLRDVASNAAAIAKHSVEAAVVNTLGRPAPSSK